jgi:hypothetical protein
MQGRMIGRSSNLFARCFPTRICCHRKVPLIFPNYRTAMESILGILIGLGLAASCGFRVFTPLLIASVSAKLGILGLSDSMQWLSSTPAIIAFATAGCVEIAAYWIPSVDHALDVIASPSAMVAGTVLAASQFGNIDPTLAWAAAAVGGGGVAGVSQSLNVAVRGASTLTTAGLVNPIISLVQSALSAIAAVLAIVAPVAAGILLIVSAALLIRVMVSRAARRRALQAMAV